MSESNKSDRWFRGKNLITLVAWLVPVLLSLWSLNTAKEANRISRDLAAKMEEEKLIVSLDGAGNRDQDYLTRFFQVTGNFNQPTVLIPVVWEVLFSNNSQTTVSMVSHETFMTRDDSRRAVESELLTSQGEPQPYPVVTEPGYSKRFFLKVPMRISPIAFRKAKSSGRFNGDFVLGDLERFLQEKHNINILGKNVHRLRRPDGSVAENMITHVVTSNDEGHLLLEVKTARGNYFSGSIHYYFGPEHRTKKPLTWPRGKPLTLGIKMEKMDQLHPKD